MCGEVLGSNPVTIQQNNPPGWDEVSTPPPVIPPQNQRPSTGVNPSPNRVPTSKPSPPHIIRLVHSTGREFYLAQGSGVIGRRTKSSTNIPDIDLTGLPDEGVVSRRHATIYWDPQQQSYLIIDHSSLNGTALNGAPLQPETAYPLGHHMTLQLGQGNLVCFTILMD